MMQGQGLWLWVWVWPQLSCQEEAAESGVKEEGEVEERQSESVAKRLHVEGIIIKG